MKWIEQYTISEHKEVIGIDSINSEFFFKEFDGSDNYPTKPYRTETFGIGFVKSGVINLTVGLSKVSITGPSLLAIGPNVIRRWKSVNQTAIVMVVFFKWEFVATHLPDKYRFNNRPYFEIPQQLGIALDQRSEAAVSLIFEQLKGYYNGDFHNRVNFVRLQTIMLHYMLDELYVEQKGLRTEAANQDIAKFIDMANQTISMRREISYYSDRLGTTKKSLSKLVKSALGVTVGRYLRELLLLEAKIRLQDTQDSVKQISSALSFPDPSTFSKYFKRYTGKTPSAYRKEYLTNKRE